MRSFPLTGFDTFILALEKQYNEKEIQGNICHYLVDLEGEADVDALTDLLSSNPYLNKLSQLQYQKAKALHIPKWHYAEEEKPCEVKHYASDELIPEEIKKQELLASEKCLMVNLVSRGDGRTTIILSWNHLLMDGYGAALLLRQLFDSQVEFDEQLFLNYEVPRYNLKTFWEATKAKFFIDYTSRPSLTMISPKHLTKESEERLHILDFSPNKVKQLDEKALRSGAKFGRSAFYLACCARAVSGVLDRRGAKMKNFWIPVPRDNRKKSAIGPIIGNRLSFLFYRLKREGLLTLESAVASINEQMMDQIRHKSYQSYNHLMDFMKWLPMSLYYYLVKRRGGNSIASFLFTVAADHPRSLDEVFGHRVIDALSLPANAYPPGLTFAFMNFHGSLKLMILYHTQALSDEEYKEMEEQLRKELTA